MTDLREEVARLLRDPKIEVTKVEKPSDDSSGCLFIFAWFLSACAAWYWLGFGIFCVYVAACAVGVGLALGKKKKP